MPRKAKSTPKKAEQPEAGVIPEKKTTELHDLRESQHPVYGSLVEMRIGGGDEIKQQAFLKRVLEAGRTVKVMATGKRIAQAAIVIGPILQEARFQVPARIEAAGFDRQMRTDIDLSYYIAWWVVKPCSAATAAESSNKNATPTLVS